MADVGQVNVVKPQESPFQKKVDSFFDHTKENTSLFTTVRGGCCFSNTKHIHTEITGTQPLEQIVFEQQNDFVNACRRSLNKGDVNQLETLVHANPQWSGRVAKNTFQKWFSQWANGFAKTTFVPLNTRLMVSRSADLCGDVHNHLTLLGEVGWANLLCSQTQKMIRKKVLEPPEHLLTMLLEDFDNWNLCAMTPCGQNNITPHSLRTVGLTCARLVHNERLWNAKEPTDLQVQFAHRCHITRPLVAGLLLGDDLAFVTHRTQHIQNPDDCWFPGLILATKSQHNLAIWKQKAKRVSLRERVELLAWLMAEHDTFTTKMQNDTGTAWDLLRWLKTPKTKDLPKQEELRDDNRSWRFPM